MKRLLKLTLALTAAGGTLAASAAFAQAVSSAAVVREKVPTNTQQQASPIVPAAIAPYCTNTYTSAVEPITLVKINDINNTSSATTGGTAHEDFTAIVGTLRPGATYAVTMQANTDGASFEHGFALYVDWNQDGLLTGANEGYWVGQVTGSTGTDALFATTYITVPADAVLGNTRLRAMTAYNTTALADLLPCRTGSGYGQSEDYTVTIDTNAAVPNLPLSVAAGFTPAAAAVPANTTLAINVGNPNAAATPLTADFTATLPTGMTLAADATTTCPGTITGTSGGSVITLASGAAIPPGGCAISASLAVSAAGNSVVAAGPVTTAEGSASTTATFFGWNTTASSAISTGFESPFTAGAINGQQSWYGNNAANVISTLNPKNGTQHYRLTSSASGNRYAITPDLTAGTTRYVSVSANVNVSNTGAQFQINPQDPANSAVTTQTMFYSGAIYAVDWATSSFVDTGATFTNGTYFNFKLLIDRATNNVRMCKDGAQIWETTDGNGTTGFNTVTNTVLSQRSATGQTANRTYDVDDLDVNYTNSYECDGSVAPHTVTPSVTGNGTISPDTAQTVADGGTIDFALSAATGNHLVDVTGSCAGTLSGTTWTAGPITADCTVIANFAADTPTTYTVTPSVTGAGSISPNTAQTVNSGATATFALSATTGNHLVDVTGTCGGTLTGTSYTTNAVTQDCTVIANFAADTGNPNIVCHNNINHTLAATTSGSSFNWTTGVVGDEDPTPPTGGPYPYDMNIWSNSGLAAYWTHSPTISAGVASSTTSADFSVLSAGTVVGASSTWSRTGGAMTAFKAGVDGYLGVRFDCSSIGGTTCYGYAHFTTTAGTGYPAVLVDSCFDKSGADITIGVTGGGAPSVTKAFSPAQVLTNADSTATITLTNPNATAATLSAALVDTLPSGLVATAASTTCGGSVSFTTGSITLASGATIPAGSCKITATVHAAAESSYVNTIAAGALQTDAGNNADAASATLIVSNTLPFPQPYCSVSFPSNVEPITLVNLTGINNPSDATVNGSPALENFLSVAGGALSRTGVYTATVEGNTDGNFTAKIKVFIDWNQNGTFDADEGFALSDLTNSTGADGKQSTGDITVPADALLGATRMRVIKKFNSVPDACNAAGYGQAEDYTVVVDSNPPPQPSADVTPFSFAMSAEEGASATDTMVVHNTGPGRLTFNVKRALPEGRAASANPMSKVLNERQIARRNDAIKAAKAGLPVLQEQDDLITAAAKGAAVPDVGNTVLANDPLCVAGTPGLVIHDGDGSPDNGYGWNAVAGTDPKYVDKFTPESYPATYTTVCATFLSNTGLSSAPVQVVVFADDGPGGEPGTELGRVAVTANNISSALSQSFQAFDISEMGLNITDGSVYIGFEWDATAVTGLYVGSDESSAVDAGGYSYSSATWSLISEGFPDYKALFVRAIEETAGEPGVGCDAPSNVSWLSATPSSGVINGVGTKDVTIKANAASLATGTYSALLCVNTNDLAHPRFEIPVTFTVTPNIANDTIFKDGFDGTPVGEPGTYTDRATFLGQVAPGYFDNPFNDVTASSAPEPARSYTDAASGIAYTIDTQPTADDLWNGTGFISTNGSGDQLVVTFTGAPVTAVGGNFFASDVNTAPIVGNQVVITLSDGTTETFSTTGTTDFRGFVTSTPITSITIDAPNPSNPQDGSWSTMDNLVVGARAQ